MAIDEQANNEWLGESAQSLSEDWREVGAETEEMWKPEKEDESIQGIYVDKKINIGDNNSNIYVLATDDGNIGLWGSTVLDGRFAKIPVGAEVKITYMGYKKSEKSAREYKAYKVEARKAPMREVK